MEANYRDFQNAFTKSQKVKQFMERETLNVEYPWKSSCLFTSNLSPRTLFFHCISSKAFLRTSLGKRFELIQISKALTTECDVRFCV